jgi:hypothetical protein
MEIRLQSGTNWIKVYRSHGRKCGLERNEWVKFYEEVMGFVNFLSFDEQINTEYSDE